jgi:hypothetical protein
MKLLYKFIKEKANFYFFGINDLLLWLYGSDLIPPAKLDEEMLNKMEAKIGQESYKHPIGLDTGLDLIGNVIIFI